MSDVIIRKALEIKLAAMSPALATAYENANFIPVTGTPYQQVNLLLAQPDNQTMGSQFYRAVGVFQISLCYPINTGANAAQARAELLKTHFKRGTSMVETGLTVIVTQTPSITSGMVVGDRYILPISIFYQCDINL